MPKTADHFIARYGPIGHGVREPFPWQGKARSAAASVGSLGVQGFSPSPRFFSSGEKAERVLLFLARECISLEAVLKSAVVGNAGAARVYQLTNADLRKAKRHGRRQDVISKARVVRNEPCLTTTGLDLRRLHAEHIADAFVPKAMHIVIQFPKGLVDGEDAALMLRHARRSVERVFGEHAIFADRVDRDEKGRHNVDIFVAPKYVKKTKHTEKLAVTMSRQLKALAEKHGKHTGPRGTGQALQDEIYEYFRQDMKLAGVQRGSPKLIAGPDWVSAEAHRADELQSQAEELAKREAKADGERKQLARDRAHFAEDRASAKAKQEQDEARVAELQRVLVERLAFAEANAEKVAEEQRALEAERAEISKQKNELATRELIAEEMTKAADARHLGLFEKEARLKAEAVSIVDQRGALAADRSQLEAESVSVAEDRAQAQADRSKAEAIRRQAEATEAKLSRARELEAEQFALLAKASDDDAGLYLRPAGTGFKMDTAPMTPLEKSVYQSPWSTALAAMARRLAYILQRAREFASKLSDREKAADGRMAEASSLMKEAGRIARAELAAERSAHEGEARELRLQQASQKEKEQALRQREANAASIASNRERWRQVIGLMGSHPDMFEIGERGTVMLSNEGHKRADADLKAHMRLEAPSWVKAIAFEHRKVPVAVEIAEREQADAQSAAHNLRSLLAKAGPLLTPTQVTAAREVKNAIARSGFQPDQLER